MLITLGILFLIGLVADVVARSTPLPRVTLLLLCGIAVGPSGFDLLPREAITNWFPILTHIALGMVGFLMGQKLSIQAFREHGRAAVVLALGKVAGAASCVFLALLLLGVPYPLALVLAGIATATAPMATFDVVKEVDGRGSFVDLLLRIVALDDAWALIVFSVLLALAVSETGNGDAVSMLGAGLLEAGGGLLLGGLLGVPMAYLTGRLDFGSTPDGAAMEGTSSAAGKGAPIQAEAFGFVFLCVGCAVLLELSPILSAMAMGGVVASLASHHSRPFHEIEGIEWPFVILFFILAGASLEIDGISALGWIALAYLVARGVGSYLGIYSVARSMHLDGNIRRWMGLALLPQAGVALGIALLAAQRLPQYSEAILTVTLSTTVVLELCSPVITRWVLKRVGADRQVS